MGVNAHPVVTKWQVRCYVKEEVAGMLFVEWAG